MQNVKNLIKSKRTQAQPKITPKITKICGSLIQNFSSKQLHVQSLGKVRWNNV